MNRWLRSFGRVLAAVLGAVLSVMVTARLLRRNPEQNIASKPAQSSAPVTTPTAAAASVPAEPEQPPPDQFQPPPGWYKLSPPDLPAPTYWPISLALAITLIAWGLVTTWLISGVGLALFALALINWIGALQRGPESD